MKDRGRLVTERMTESQLLSVLNRELYLLDRELALSERSANGGSLKRAMQCAIALRDRGHQLKVFEMSEIMAMSQPKPQRCE